MTERRGTRRRAKPDAEEVEEQKEPEKVSVPVGAPDHFRVYREWMEVPYEIAQEWDQRLWTRRRVWPL